MELRDDERQVVECWTRCMGYFRPVSQYNPGKVSEFKERVWFLEEKATKNCKGDAEDGHKE
jgi:hypothetical protein